MKNDAFTDNFPPKYFFSAALHNGTFPLWNPYLNFGFPIYADYGFAYYNPVTWFFGFIGYNAYTFTVEVLVYLYMAGLSMFILSQYLLNDRKIAFLCASMYMCSGFFIGHLQHINFITGAAFVPLTIYSFLLLLKLPNYKNGIKFTLSLYMVLACGHPAIPIGTIYILFFLFIILALTRQIVLKEVFKKYKYFVFSFLALVILLSPAIYAYIVMLPYYGFLHKDLAINPGAFFNSKSTFSLLFPAVVHANNFDWGNDISMRNSYFSIAGICFALSAIIRINKRMIPFLVIALLGLLLSFGNPISTAVSQFLPFLDKIRTVGEYRVFFLLFFIIISGYGVRQCFEKVADIKQHKSVKAFFYLLMMGSIAGLALSLSKQNIIHHLLLASKNNLSAFVKTAVNHFSTADGFFIHALVLLCLCVFFLSKKMTLQNLSLLIVADLVAFSWIALAFTGLSQKPVSYIHSSIESYPAGFPIPNNQNVVNDGIISTELESYIGDESYYNKSIGTKHLTDYPSYFSSTENALKSADANAFLNKPFAFILDDSLNKRNQLSIASFTPNRIEISYALDKGTQLGLLQNSYPFWHASVKEQEIRTFTVYSSFIAFRVPAGKGQLIVEYKDNVFFILFSFSMIVFISLLLLLCRNKPFLLMTQ